MSTEQHDEPTHEGPSPYHGGLTTHRGRREDCTGPDCDPSEAALLRLVAEHGETYRSLPGVWLWSLADSPGDLSLLAVRPDEREWDTRPGDSAALLEAATQAIRNSNGTPEALAWWKAHPQLIPAHVYAAAVLSVLSGPATEQPTTTRTKWPAAQHLQQAADRTREPDPNLGTEREFYTAPLGDWLNKVANEMAWLAPYREHEGGYRPWRTATRAAHGVLGLPDADGCTVCHPQRRSTAVKCTCEPGPYREQDEAYSHWAGCPIADAEQQAAEQP